MSDFNDIVPAVPGRFDGDPGQDSDVGGAGFGGEEVPDGVGALDGGDHSHVQHGNPSDGLTAT